MLSSTSENWWSFIIIKRRQIIITKLVSLDTSSSCSGWAVFINGEYLNSGVFNYRKEKDGEERLKKMCINLLSFLNKEDPNIIAVECTVVSRNVQAQRTLTKILGVIYGWCITHDCEYIELRPTEWRSLTKRISTEKIGRTREELKQWSIKRVKELFGLEVSDDEADALLIGQALINRYKE